MLRDVQPDGQLRDVALALVHAQSHAVEAFMDTLGPGIAQHLGR